MIARVTERLFDRDVLERSHERPIVVEFTAEWCAPCRVLAPLLEDAARARDGLLDLVAVDVEESPGLARRFQIRALPAVRAFHRGAVVERFSGARRRSRVERFFDDVAAHGSR